MSDNLVLSFKNLQENQKKEKEKKKDDLQKKIDKATEMLIKEKETYSKLCSNFIKDLESLTIIKTINMTQSLETQLNSFMRDVVEPIINDDSSVMKKDMLEKIRTELFCELIQKYCSDEE